jgi:hypothetical protein
MFWIGLLVSLCYVPGITGAYIATQWPVLAVVLSCGLLRRGPFTAFHVLGLAFIAYAAIGMLWSPNLYSGVHGLWLVTIAALSVWFGTTIEDPRKLYAGLAVGAAVSSVVAVFQYFGVPVVPTTSTAPAGLYVNSVQQGTVLAIVAVALATERMWLWALPLVPGLWLAHSRGGAVVLLVGLLSHFVRSLWVVAGILAIVGPFYLFSPLSSSDAQRTFIWRTTWDGLTWFGWGVGVFYDVLFSQNGVLFFPEYVHNDFLQLAVEYGVGAALPLAVIGYAAWRTDAREWPVVMAFCTAACFSMPLFMPIVAFLSLASVGRILRVHGLHGDHGGDRGRAGLQGLGFRFAARPATVSVAPRYSGEG